MIQPEIISTYNLLTSTVQVSWQPYLSGETCQLKLKDF